jgi:hypothetical protein
MPIPNPNWTPYLEWPRYDFLLDVKSCRFQWDCIANASGVWFIGQGVQPNGRRPDDKTVILKRSHASRFELEKETSLRPEDAKAIDNQPSKGLTFTFLDISAEHAICAINGREERRYVDSDRVQTDPALATARQVLSTVWLVRVGQRQDLVRRKPDSRSSADCLAQYVGVSCVILIDGKKELWYGTREGLFRLQDHPSAKPTLISHMDSVDALTWHDGFLWVGTTKGLYRCDPPKNLIPQLAWDEPGRVHDLRVSNGILWIGAANGIYRLLGNDRQRDPQSPTGELNRVEFFEDKSGLWAAVTVTHKGITRSEWYRGTGTELRPVPCTWGPFVAPEFSAEFSSPQGDKFVLRESFAQFAYPPFRNVERLKEFHSVGSGYYVLNGGLFRERSTDGDLSEVTSIPIRVQRPDGEIVHENGTSMRGVTSVTSSGSVKWFGTKIGLFRWNEKTEPGPQYVKQLDTGPVDVVWADQDILWVMAEKGLFFLKGLTTPQSPTIKLLDPQKPEPGSKPDEWTIPSEMGPQREINIRWQVEGWERQAVRDQIPGFVHVSTAGKTDTKAGIWRRESGMYEATIEAVDPGEYTLWIEVRDLHGNSAESKKVNFKITSPNLLQHLEGWLKWATIAYASSIVILFVALVAAARRSPAALGVLTHPWVRRLGLFYGLVLRYCRPLRLWCLEPYSQALQTASGSDHPYVPEHLRGPDGSPIDLGAVLDRLRHRDDTHVWVRGRPGTGKSELALEVVRRHAACASLHAGWRHFGFVPVFVRLRDTIRPDVAGMVIDVLARAGLPVRDDAFFRGLLRAGDFLVILDGVNEARIDDRVRDKLIEAFVVGRGSRLLATSQTPPAVAGVTTYTLPEVNPEFARALFHSFAGSRGEELVARVPETLWPDLASGYDVRLVADLARTGREVPGNRLGIYQAALDSARVGLDTFPEDAVCQLAWETWRASDERFAAGRPPSRLGHEVEKALVEAHVLASRGVEGETPYFGFAHELMQGYLAARWAAVHATTAVLRLDDEAVWALSPTRQDRVFAFLSELVAERQGADGLKELAEFAMEASDGSRGRLQTAAVESARRLGWALSLEERGREAKKYIEALCDLQPGEFDQLIVTLDLNPADLAGPDRRSGAVTVYRLARRDRSGDRLRRLRELIDRFSPGLLSSD